jgi:hypothetical protein
MEQCSRGFTPCLRVGKGAGPEGSRGERQCAGDRGREGGGQEEGLTILLIHRFRFLKSSFTAFKPTWVGGAGQRRQAGRHQRRAGRGSRVEGRQKTGSRARLDQGCAEGVSDKVMNHLLLAKAHLGLGGMYVDVDFLGRQFEE